MLPSWRTDRELSDEAEEISFENIQLRRLIHQQRAIIQQLQIRKDSLLQDASSDDITEVFSNESPELNRPEWQILIQTLPIFSQSETAITSFNERNRMRGEDADLPEPKYLELKCTKYCPPGKCRKRKRIFEVRRKPYFNSVLVSEDSSEVGEENNQENLGHTDNADTESEDDIVQDTAVAEKTETIDSEGGKIDTDTINSDKTNDDDVNNGDTIDDDITDDDDIIDHDRSDDFIPGTTPNTEPLKDLSVKDRMHLLTMIKRRLDKSHIEKEFQRRTGRPMRKHEFLAISGLHFQASKSFDRWNRKNEVEKFYHECKTKILDELSRKKVPINDVVAIANDIKSRPPFCKNSKLCALTFNYYQIGKFLQKLPVKRRGGFLYKIKS